MSDFDRQVRERKEHDRLHLHHAVRSLTGTVNREKGYDSGMKLNAEEDAALYDLCRFYDLPDKELSSELTGIDEKLNYLLESRGVMRRRVTLDGDWWRHMSGIVHDLCGTSGCRHSRDGASSAFPAGQLYRAGT